MPKPFDVASQLASLSEEVVDKRSRQEPAKDGWPSREPVQQSKVEEPQGQITMRGRMAVIERFRAICKDDRRTYIDMLEILMDRYGGRGK